MAAVASESIRLLKSAIYRRYEAGFLDVMTCCLVDIVAVTPCTFPFLHRFSITIADWIHVK
jgi:hypothetical protein